VKLLLYARGGGMGHLNRAYSIAMALRPHSIEPLVLTTSALVPALIYEQLSLLRWPGFAPAVSSAGWSNTLSREHLRALIQNLAPDLMVVDTFDNGPENELQALPFARLILQRDGSSPRSPHHLLVNPLGLGYVLNTPPAALALPAQAHHFWSRDLGGGPLVVVAHNGDAYETRAFFEQVLHYFAETHYQVRLASLLPCLKPEWRAIWCSAYPLAPWLAGVDLLIGGGGYNLVAEAQCYGVRGYFQAFERPVDRQWERLQQHFSFYEGIAKADFLETVQTLLSKPAPAPLPLDVCQGAEAVAKVIAEYLT
jgi:hypothetical protein